VATGIRVDWFIEETDILEKSLGALY
jgi:hypothetical protein